MGVALVGVNAELSAYEFGGRTPEDRSWFVLTCVCVCVSGHQVSLSIFKSGWLYGCGDVRIL